jgi:hypothetical protein
MVIPPWALVKVRRRKLRVHVPDHVRRDRRLAHGSAGAASVDQVAMAPMSEEPNVLQRLLKLDRETDGPQRIVHTYTP